MVTLRTSSSLSYNGSSKVSSETCNGSLGTTIAGPGEFNVSAGVNGDALLYLCICTFYAYVSGNKYVSESIS